MSDETEKEKIITGVVIAIIVGGIYWAGRRIKTVWEAGKNRRNMVREVDTALFNFCHNFDARIDFYPGNMFPLILPNGQINVRIQQETVAELGTIQSLVMKFTNLRGLIGLSKRQRNFLIELNDRLSNLAFTLEYYGSNAVNARATRASFGNFHQEKLSPISLQHIHRSYSHLKLLVCDLGYTTIRRPMSLFYRFCPKRLAFHDSIHPPDLSKVVVTEIFDKQE